MIGRKNVFYSKSGFLNLFKRKEPVSDATRLDWTMRCPRCEVEMRKVTRMGVTIDVCDRCGGMWLDKGEMDSLNNVRNAISAPAVETQMPRSKPKKKNTKKSKSK